MLSRDLFKEALAFIAKKQEHEHALIAALELCSPQEYVNALIYSEYYEFTLKLLCAAMDIPVYDDILYYWVIDLDFGKKYTPGCLADENNNNIDISTADKLYDYIVSISQEGK